MSDEKRRHFEIKFSPWNAPTDLKEKSYEDVLRSWATIMWNGYVNIQHRDPMTFRLDRKKIHLAFKK